MLHNRRFRSWDLTDRDAEIIDLFGMGVGYTPFFFFFFSSHFVYNLLKRGHFVPISGVKSVGGGLGMVLESHNSGTL